MWGKNSNFAHHKNISIMLPDKKNKKLTINARGHLLQLTRPQVMGILNLTPDSFYDAGSYATREQIHRRVADMIAAGVDIIDVGGYSSRPGCADVSPDEEMRRLATGLDVLRRLAPHAIVSVDTFRADVARRCIEQYDVQIINDISAGEADEAMFPLVASMQVPYIMMHMRGTPATMMQQENLRYDNIVADVLQYFAAKIERLTLMGVNDIIIDPGFGFSKTLAHNYTLLRHLDEFLPLGLPLLVGISRKSMIYKLLDITPADSLNATTALNVLALLGGADILRVHDVREAVEAVKIVTQTLKD